MSVDHAEGRTIRGDAPVASIAGPDVDAWRLKRRRRKRRFRLVTRLLSLAAAALLAVVLYSYATTMLQPSSLPLGIRTVEWLRGNGAAWLVNDVERLYYSWNAPAKGGPPLRALPNVGARSKASIPISNAPPRVSPLLTPRIPGEGVWRPTGPTVAQRAPVLVTTFRPERDYPRVVAYVAWVDHTRTQLALYPGRYEPPSGGPRGPMLVPFGERWRLLATFNSGFTHRDGHGGFSIGNHTYAPLSPDLGTLVAYRNGRVDVTAWHGAPNPGPVVVFARQNLPLIVDHGRPNTNLNDGSQWGATLGNAIRVWRSAVGIDRHGNLIYVAANDQTVRTLAAILIHVGAVRAIELDINAEWPSFITYAHNGRLSPSKLVPNGQQPANRYLVPDDRDFFAVYSRTKGSAPVPFG